MARTVADAAALLGAMAGVRSERRGDQGRGHERPAATTRHRSTPTACSGARIGVVRNRLFGYSPAADRLAEAAIADLKRQGAVIVDPANIPTLGKFDDS